MNPSKCAPCLIAAIIFSISHINVHGENDPAEVTYEQFIEIFGISESINIDGADYLLIYLRSNDPDVIFNPKKANLRIRDKRGKVSLVKVDSVQDLDKALLGESDKKLIEEGYLHRAWVPKDFKGGFLVHSLPKGSLQMIQCFRLQRR